MTATCMLANMFLFLGRKTWGRCSFNFS